MVDLLRLREDERPGRGNRIFHQRGCFVKLLRSLAVLGCLLLLAMPAQADPTVCTFSGAATDTNYIEYGGGGYTLSDGPPNAVNYYRLCTTGIGSQNNSIAFDMTAPGPSSHIVVDFDYRIGGTPDNGSPSNHADGIGFALLNTDVYNQSGTGPGITEEAQGVHSPRDNSIGFGLDTWDNGPTPPNGGNNYDPDNNHVSITYIGGGNDGPGGTSILLETSLTPFGYNLHRGESPEKPFDDTKTLFDHFNATIDFDSNGATVTVTITPNSIGGAAFSPISGLLIKAAKPHEVRAAFGARTGGSTDNEDIANVNITFSP
jgi:Bacterial lectin